MTRRKTVLISESDMTSINLVLPHYIVGYLMTLPGKNRSQKVIGIIREHMDKSGMVHLFAPGEEFTLRGFQEFLEQEKKKRTKSASTRTAQVLLELLEEYTHSISKTKRNAEARLRYNSKRKGSIEDELKEIGRKYKEEIDAKQQ